MPIAGTELIEARGVTPTGQVAGSSELMSSGAIAIAARAWPKIAVLGDSISANGGTLLAGLPGGLRILAPQGYTAWLPAIYRQQIQLEPYGNFSLSGRTSVQIATSLQSAINYAPSICIVEAGTNDPGNGLVISQTIAALTYMYSSLLGAGTRVVAIPITVRTGQSAATYGYFAQVNQFIRRYAQQNPGMIIADVDIGGYANVATGVPIATLTSDGLHPNPAGAFIFAKTIKAALGSQIPVFDTYPLQSNINDTFDPVNNTTGNLLTTNPLFTTTTGGSIGSNTGGALTGTFPSGVQANFTGSGTYTGSLVGSSTARTDGLPGNLVRFTATSFAGTPGTALDKAQLYLQFNMPTGVNVGDTLEAFVIVNVNMTAGLSGFGIDLGITDGSGNSANTLYASHMQGYTTAAAWPQGTYSLVLKTPRNVVPPAGGAVQRVLSVSVEAYFDTTAATGIATGTIDFGGIGIRRVV